MIEGKRKEVIQLVKVKKEIVFMKRITLVLGIVAVMVVMLVALAAPAMAKDKGAHHNNGRHLGQVHKKLNHL